MDAHAVLDETFDPTDGIDLRAFLLKVVR